MPEGALTSTRDIEDFTRGTDFLSASGGGPTTESRAFLQEALDAGRRVGWIELEDAAGGTGSVFRVCLPAAGENG